MSRRREPGWRVVLSFTTASLLVTSALVRDFGRPALFFAAMYFGMACVRVLDYLVVKEDR